MACKCQTMKKVDNPAEHVIRPDEPCLFCAEKHFTEAFSLHNEGGYSAINRHAVMGALVLAQWHCYKDHKSIAEKLRNIRHYIQNRREKETFLLWEEVSRELDHAVNATLEVDEYGFSKAERKNMKSGLLDDIIPEDYAVNKDFTENIYVFSNVSYPVENKLELNKNDLLVFLNKSRSEKYYSDHKRKISIKRNPERNYGDPLPNFRNIYLFHGDFKLDADVVPAAIANSLTDNYNYDYDCPPGKVKCPTTGFLAVRLIQRLLPNGKIHLVNFGEDVKNSTYRYPAHNWKWEHEQLLSLPHLYLE